MVLIARGRAEGLNCFGDTRHAFYVSLTPGLGVIGAATVDAIAEGQSGIVLGAMLGPLCALLAPSVLSYEMARLWGREAFWNRFIVAFNWCQWLIPPLGLALLGVLAFAHAAGYRGSGGFRILVVCIAAYALWLNWFLARHGLALGRGRAALLVAAVTLGNALIVFAPGILAVLIG